tara:strand:+ start:1237 stop:1701 length:465 start_codon:yes stop_codon:yes gene_type:complete
MKLKILILIFCMILTSNCGFKLSNVQNNYNISEFNTKGDKRINYKLKNKILNSSKKENENLILVNINTKKEKNIKEKNIGNEITKYEIIITSNIEFKKITDNNFNTFTVIEKGDYTISKRYSDTLSNEKSLINTLVNDLSDEIIQNLSLRLNDL